MALTIQVQSKPLMIAHAGGGINSINYSNSIEALDKNHTSGFRYFEIDFSWTSDKQLVCIHDWKKIFKKIFRFKIKQPPSLIQFNALLDESTTLHPCTLTTLAHWLKNHPDSKIITDVKYDNLKAIKLIVENYPYIQKQLIPQFYQPYEYQELKNMGFNNLIWILYQYKGSNSSVVEHAKNMQLMAVSMNKSQAKKKFAKQLINNGKSLFVYTINKRKLMKKLVDEQQVSGIYTDFLN